jgi:hypothetical protein
MWRKSEIVKEDIKSREVESVNSPNTSGLRVRECRKKVIKTDVHNRKTSEDSEKRCCKCPKATCK